jgi:hypothetical protein
MTTTMTKVLMCWDFLYKRCNVVLECLPLITLISTAGLYPVSTKVWLQPYNAPPFFPDCVVAEFVDRC